jgi:hypothetical protein
MLLLFVMRVTQKQSEELPKSKTQQPGWLNSENCPSGVTKT